MQIINGIPVWGEPILDVVAQMKKIQEHGAFYCALMADHHLGYSVPVGGVVAFENKICVNGVGFDIACGNKAALLNLKGSDVKKNISIILDDIQAQISFGVGRKNFEKVHHPLFEDPLFHEIKWLKELKTKAIGQFGTIGSGNHFVDIFADELDRVWVGVHFGSRGLGHAICSHFIKAGGGVDGVHAKPVIFAENSDLGEQYLRCMELAGRYAYAGRDWVVDKIAKILKADILETVHNHHNFAWQETHFGKKLWVVRKGATPAFPGQKSFIGGSMGDISVIIEGMDSIESQKALYSTIHGAGRILSRNQAKGKRDFKTGKILSKGLIDPIEHHNWLKKMEVEVRGGDLDESPLAYKRIEEVLKAHQNTIAIKHTLKPIGVCMADDRTLDPFRD